MSSSSGPPGSPDPDAPIEEDVAGAWRPTRPGGGIRFHPGWYDLDEAARLRAFDAATANRVIESSLDARGLSATAKSVLRRIRATEP
jgi:hypothetical protein